MNFKKNSVISQIINLYSGSGWKSLFTKIRFWDAPYLIVEKMIPQKGYIIDLGCGEGIFSNFLGISSKGRKVLGIEVDINRLKVANHGIKNVTFKWGDATKIKLPFADTIILFHVLHHLNSYEAQESVIDNCLRKLKKGGKLIIVEVEPKISFRYFITWLTDHFIVPILFEKRLYSQIFFRNSNEWKKFIHERDFKCNITLAEKGYPFTHVILECQKTESKNEKG